jgi:Transmembrane family 220, helix
VVIAALIFGVLFLIGAAVQYNDPDPLRWALLYLAAAAASFAGALGRLPRVVPIVVAVVSVAWAATLAPQVLSRGDFAAMFGGWEMANAGIEESREFWGLLIIAGWMGVLAVFHRHESTWARLASSKLTTTANRHKG